MSVVKRLEDRRVVQGGRLEPTVRFTDQGEGVLESRELFEAKNVDLDQPEGLRVPLIDLT